MSARKRPPRGASLEELWAIADACDVPRSFMEFGWGAISDVEPRQDDGVDRRLRNLERQVQQLLAAKEETGRDVGVADAVAPLVETDESRTPEAPGEPASRPGAQRRRSA